MTDRERILGAIRAGLGKRTALPLPAPLVPARGRLGEAERRALFRRQIEAASASCAMVSDSNAVPEAIADYLRRHNLPMRLRLAPDLADLPWSRQPLLEVEIGGSDGAQPIGVTGALAGIAETGTLILASSPKSPASLAFLPETHIAILNADRIYGAYEEALALIPRDAEGRLPRSVNFITGPSRSADIGKTLLMGAHGPKRLHVILIGEATDHLR